MSASPELLAEAREWIARNGKPYIPAIERAIRTTEAWGDPRNENPFRRALIEASR